MSNTLHRKIDEKGRVAVFSDFAGQFVIVERISEDEIRIRRAAVVPQKYTLVELLANVTPEQLHGETETGPAVGNEVD